MGLLILRALPNHLVGRLMLVGGVVGAAGNGLLEVARAALHDAPSRWDAQLGATVGTAGRAVGWLLIVLVLPLVFPDGRRAGPRRLRRTAWAVAWGCVALQLLSTLLSPHQTDLRLTRIENPIGLPEWFAPLTAGAQVLGLFLSLAGLVLAVAVLVWRWRHSEAVDRQRLLWLGLAFIAPVAVLLLSFADAGSPALFALTSLPMPVAIAVACLQHRLYDLELAISRTLAYTGLSLSIAAIYALVVGGVGAMLRQQGADWLGWVAAGAIAVSFAPLREGLQRGANRLVFGQWAQPAEVLAATGRRLVDATDAPGLLEALVDELATGLGLSHVSVTDTAGATLAAYGTPGPHAQVIALRAYGAPVGELRWDGPHLRELDRALLDDVAHQLGAVVHAAGLVSSLRASQERLVLAREEERRRLRRDLHDGLGPTLAALTLEVDNLRQRLRSAELGPAVDTPLLDLRSGIQSTVLDVRRIVDGLRPPALDDLGLEEALRQLARRLGDVDGPTVQVCASTCARLSAAVEVAAYRIAAEALTNAIRHAGAQWVEVRLETAPGLLTLQVRDDGSGAASPRDGGVGLQSMRERAEELGGSLTVDGAGPGTLVTARLPLAREERP
jgi:signal transduction histidine kinase